MTTCLGRFHRALSCRSQVLRAPSGPRVEIHLYHVACHVSTFLLLTTFPGVTTNPEAKAAPHTQAAFAR